jgi:hypothetical protein
MVTPIRCAIAVELVAPLATVLGFCFPLGLWAVNGACGVLASIAAVAISISLGIRANLFCAAVLYLSVALPAGVLVALGRNQTER